MYYTGRGADHYKTKRHASFVNNPDNYVELDAYMAKIKKENVGWLRKYVITPSPYCLC